MCANPQKENGFTPTANEIEEALSRTVLSSYEHQIIHIVLRQTYGYHRKKWQLKRWREIEDFTGINKTHIQRTLNKLVKKNIIELDTEKKEITFLKYYDKWVGYKPIGKVTQSGNQKLPNQVTKKLPNQVTKVTQLGNSTQPETALSVTLPDPKDNLKIDLKKDLNKSLSPVHGSNIVHVDDEIRKKERENSLSLSEEDRAKKDRVMKIVEDEFPFYFDKALKYTQRTKAMTEMMVEIGNYADRVIQHEVHEVCKGLQQPVNLIKFVYNNLKNNGHKPIEGTWESKVSKKRVELKNKLENCSSKEEFFVILRDRAFLDEDRIPDLWDGYKKERLKWDVDYSLDDFMELFNKSKKNMTIDDVIDLEVTKGIKDD